jgi:hypothetical protein
MLVSLLVSLKAQELNNPETRSVNTLDEASFILMQREASRKSQTEIAKLLP